VDGMNQGGDDKSGQMIPEEEIAETAAAWVARLASKTATAADRADLKAWLDADPAHAAAYQEFTALWGELGGVKAPDFVKTIKRRRRRRVAANVCAAGLIAVLVPALYNMGAIDRLRADYYTSVGEVKQIALEDGSTLHLDTDSAVRLRFSTAERHIDLLRGTAFIDVAHDTARPLIISDGSVNARAVGTHFAVDRDAEPTKVGVEEGRVEVSLGTRRVLLGAGEAARPDDKGGLLVFKEDVATATQWRNSKLIFSGQPLRSVLKTLARYRHGQIVLWDQAIGDAPVSGVFDTGNTNEALRIIASTLPVTVDHYSEFFVLIRARP